MIELLKFKDYTKNPIISPESGSEIKGIFNPAVIVRDGIFYLFYRAVSSDELTGRIYLVRSTDGINFTEQPELIIYPEYNYEKYGCEDPRIIKVEDLFCLTYVGNSGKYGVGNICLAISRDLVYWDKQGSILQPGKSWDKGQVKAGVIVPEKIRGKYVMYFMGEEKPWEGGSIGIAYSDDLINWSEEDNPALLPRKGYFDSKAIEPGTNPVVEDEGVFMIYNGWGEDCIYKPCSVLFSREDPTRVLKREDKPILKPVKDWGKFFNCNGHIVAEGLVKYEEYWWLYYGAADRAICLARSEVIK